MMYLFSESGLTFLESLCFTKTLFAFDFDGTLSKIVLNPNDAKPDKTTSDWMKRLGTHAPIAVISGRSLEDLKSRIKLESGYLVGNHGLEGISSSNQQLISFRESCESWKIHFKQLLEKSDPGGLEIEDKVYSLAIHFRKSRKRREAKMAILDIVTNLDPPPRIIMGKCVINLIPVGAPHKGVALLELMLKAGTNTAFYIGDDDTDEDVFSLTDARIFTVRVGKKENSQAKYFIKSQSEINNLIKKIVAFHEREKSLNQKAAQTSRANKDA